MKQNRWKKSLCITLGILLLGAALYLRFFAPISVKVAVETTQIDKLLHIIGGVFLGSLIEWRMRHLSFRQALWLIILLFISWKTVELLFDPTARYYIARHWEAWTLDCTGDGAATILGGLFYWRAALYSPPKNIA